MQKRVRHLYRTVAVAITISSVISCLLPTSSLGRNTTLGKPVASSAVLAPPSLQGEQAVQQLKEQGLYDSLGEAMAATRYELSWEEQPTLVGLPPSYHAPNAAHRLASYFTPTELHLSPLLRKRVAETEDGPSKSSSWSAAIRFVGYGYGDNLLPVGAPADLAAQDNRIEYRRPELSVTEWYVNKPEGLEQGFTVDEPPGTRVGGARLRLTLEVTGDLRPEVVEESQAIALRHINGEMALRYGELHAYDANEQELLSELKVEGGQVILEVEDANAVYPVTIDPLITQQQQLIALDGAAHDEFGTSVALSGDTAIVGAPSDDIDAKTDQGSAYVFVRSGTSWSQQQRISAPDGAAGDNFGHSVAISGDTAVVGALSDDSAAYAEEGSAYIFVRSGTTWSKQQKLSSPSAAAGDLFGSSVAISDDTTVVGAPYDDIGPQNNRGTAYVFVRSGATWSLQNMLASSDGEGQDQFGCSVAISGDTVIVGALWDYTGYSVHGSAYVFVRSGATWSQQQKLTGIDDVGYEFFGCSVAISGNTVVVGAYGEGYGRGFASVFTFNGRAWSPQQKLTITDSEQGLNFGYSVAISGDTVVVGGYKDDIGPYTDQGSAYVFTRSGGSWSQQQQLTASDGAANDGFGSSVAISGDTVVVGSHLDDIGATVNQGSTYVFGAWAEQQKLSAPVGAAYDRFGLSVAISGDTAVVGVPNDDIAANPDQGSAHVFVRSGTTWSHQQMLTAVDGASNDNFGSSVTISGDTVLVGAHLDDVGSNTDQGSAYLFVRSGTTWSQLPKLLASDGATYQRFGSSVAINGSVAIVGAPIANSSQGTAYVFLGIGPTWTQQQKLTAGDGTTGDNFAKSVAISGNTIVVGAPYDDIGANSNQGSAYVFLWNGAIWDQQQKLTAGDGAADDLFGLSVAISGDTAVVGAPYADAGVNSDQGSAYVLVRSGTTWSQLPKLVANDGAANDKFGVSVGISGATAVVGAGYDTIGSKVYQGSAYVFLVSGSAWNQQQQLTGTTGASGDRLGSSVAISGNTVVAGAPSDDFGAYLDQGAAYVFVRK